MLVLIEIGGIWRPGQDLKLAVVLLKPLMNHFGFVAGHIIILKETPAGNTVSMKGSACSATTLRWYVAKQHPRG